VFSRRGRLGGDPQIDVLVRRFEQALKCLQRGSVKLAKVSIGKSA
jgi:hypothetical protein